MLRTWKGLDQSRRQPEQGCSAAVRTGIVLVLALALCAGALAVGGAASAAPEDASNETTIEINETTADELSETFVSNVTGEVQAVSAGIADREAVDPIMSGTVTTSNDEPVDSFDVRIEEIGGNEVIEIVSFEGRWAAPVPEGTYQVEASAEGDTTTTEVVHEEGGDSDIDVIQEIERCDGDTEIITNPDEIETFEEVTFRVCPSGLRAASEYSWDIGGDRKRVSGGEDQAPRTVTHEFEQPGDYTVEVETVPDTGASASREVSVDGADLAINHVRSSNNFWVFQGLGFDASVLVTGFTDNELETVEFTVTEENGDVVFEETVDDPDEPGVNDGFAEATMFNVSKIDDDAVVDVEVTDTEGNVARDSASYTHWETPSWLEWTIAFEEETEDGSIEIIREGSEDGEEIRIEAERDLIDIEDPASTVPDAIPIGALASLEATVGTEGEVNFAEREIGGGVYGDGEMRVPTPWGPRSGEVNASGTLYAQPRAGQNPALWFDRLELELLVALNVVEVPNYEIALKYDPTIGSEYEVASAEIGFDAGPYVRGELDIIQNNDTVTPFGFDNGLLGLGVQADAVGDIDIIGDVGSGEVEGEGQFGAVFTPVFDVPPGVTNTGWDTEATVTGEASVARTFSCEIDGGFEVYDDLTEPDYTITTEAGCSQDILSTNTTTDAGQTLPAALTDGGELQPASAQNADEFVRLTDREGADTEPALALRSGDDDVLAWAVEHNTTEGDRIDIAVNVDDHTTPESLTRDQFLTGDDIGLHFDPTAEQNGDDVLVSWTAIDNSTPNELTLDDAASEFEVGYAIHDGSTWTNTSLLTDSDRIDRVPTVAAVPEGWVIAWQQDDDFDVNASKRIRYATVTPDGTVSDIETIEGAVEPDLGTDGHSVDLAYRDRETDELVYERLTVDDPALPPDRTTVAEHQTEDLQTFATGTGAVAWTEGTVRSNRTIQYATNSTVESIPIEDGYEGIHSLDIVQTEEGTAVTFQGSGGDSAGSDIAYVLEAADTGEWSAARPIVADPDSFDLSQETVVSTDDGFLTAFVGSISGADGEEELFAATSGFAPDYQVDVAAAPEDLEPNEEFAVNITVSNTGDVAATEEVSATLTAGGSQLDATEIAPLGAGENTTASLTGETGDSVPSTATVAVDDTEALTQHTAANSEVEIDLATPDLSVRKTDEYSTDDEDDTATVEFNVTNTDVVVPESFAVEVTNDREVVGATTVDTLAPGENEIVTVNVNQTAINQSLPTRVRAVEGETTLDDRPISLLDSSLSISESIQFVETTDGTFARLSITNEGVGAVDTMVRSKRLDDGNFTEFATTSLVLNGTTQDNSTTTTVLAPIDDLDEGETVRFVAGDTLNDRTPVDNVLETEVGTIVPLTGPVELTAVDRMDGTTLENATITIKADLDRSDAERTIATDAAGVANATVPAGDITIIANKTGYASTEQIATIEEDEENDITVELSPDTDRVIGDYTDNEGIVRLDGVRDAITDWQDGVIDTDLLIEVIDAWSDGSPVS